MATVQEFMNKFIEGTLGRKTKEGRWSVERRDGIELLVYQPKREDLLENVSQLPTTEVMGLPFHLPLISKGAECNRLVDSSPELFHYMHDKPLLIK